MTRQFLISASFAALLITSAGAQADCGSYGCNKRYGRFTARQVYGVFQQRPELIQRFPRIARELQAQFGAIQPAPAATPAVPVEAAPATPPIPPTPATASPGPAPAAAQAPAVAPPAAEIPQVATPSEAPATDANPAIDGQIEVDANGFPADLPFEDPLGDL